MLNSGISRGKLKNLFLISSKIFLLVYSKMELESEFCKSRTFFQR